MSTVYLKKLSKRFLDVSNAPSSSFILDNDTSPLPSPQGEEIFLWAFPKNVNGDETHYVIVDLIGDGVFNPRHATIWF